MMIFTILLTTTYNDAKVCCLEEDREKKEEHAFVRLIIIIPFPFVVVACVFYRLCDALTVREFYERECVHIRASL